MTRIVCHSLLALAVLAPLPTFAITTTYEAVLTPLNNSGVQGIATLALDQPNDTLTVTINLSGLTPGVSHPMHLHGVGADSTTPGRAILPTDDLDHDGIIESGEAEAAVGAPLFSFVAGANLLPGSTSNLTLFPAAGADGSLHFQQVYTLLPNQFETMRQLGVRSIEIHGMVLPAGAGAGTSGEADGTAGYKAELPVAGGPLVLVGTPGTPGTSGGTPPGGQGTPGAPVPEPMSVSLLGLSVGALLWRFRRR